MKRWLIAWLLASSATAFAAPCGVYTESKSGERIEFSADGTAREYGRKGIVQEAAYHYREGAKLFVRDAENDLAKQFQLAANGKQLLLKDKTWGDKTYVAKQAYQCKPVPAYQYLRGGECKSGDYAQCCAAGDAGACVQKAAGDSDTAGLKKLCASQPQACIELANEYERKANSGAGFNMYAEKKPLPDAQLGELAGACVQHLTPELCRKASDQLWLAKEFLAARSLIGMMCTNKLDEQACDRFNALSTVELPKQLPVATALPCGEYKAGASALLSELPFGDRGTVAAGMGGQMRARLEDGLIKIRHDKGGDFVYARLGEDKLLGLDSWNRMAVFVRTEAPAKACLPPVVYKEVELSNSCGLDKDPKQCCAAGDTQGCNRLGTMAALSGNWKEAAGQYAKVCAKGVRVGCENWIHTVSKTGDDEGVENGLAALCKQDERHVACDLLEQNKVAEKAMLFALEEAFKEAPKKK